MVKAKGQAENSKISEFIKEELSKAKWLKLLIALAKKSKRQNS
jgi:hypothetical protein